MSAIAEGRAAYTLGCSQDANPYRKAKHSMTEYDDGLYRKLMDWESQWDSGYAIQKRINGIDRQ